MNSPDNLINKNVTKRNDYLLKPRLIVKRASKTYNVSISIVNKWLTSKKIVLCVYVDFSSYKSFFLSSLVFIAFSLF